MQKAFKNKAVAINNISARKISINDAKDAFKFGFEKGLNIELLPYSLSNEQLQYVEHLANNKYESDEWNYKR